MHVVHVNCAIDAQGRGPEELLRAAALDHFERELSPAALGRKLLETYRALILATRASAHGA